MTRRNLFRSAASAAIVAVPALASVSGSRLERPALQSVPKDQQWSQMAQTLRAMAREIAVNYTSPDAQGVVDHGQALNVSQIIGALAAVMPELAKGKFSPVLVEWLGRNEQAGTGAIVATIMF